MAGTRIFDHIAFLRLEPISKCFEEHGDAGELDKSQEIGDVVLPADEEPPFPLVRRDQVDPVLVEGLIDPIAVIG